MLTPIGGRGGRSEMLPLPGGVSWVGAARMQAPSPPGAGAAPEPAPETGFGCEREA